MQVKNLLISQTYSSNNKNSKPKRTYTHNYDVVNFSGKKGNDDLQYINAQKYANRQRFLSFFKHKNLPDYDLNKLEGIQEGIKIFEGLSMKEIAFMLQDLHGIAVKRGCSNQCLHCYAGAKPSGKDKDNYITRMPFETFCDITDGIKQLKERIGINPLTHKGDPYTDIYYDADCMEISLFDKQGKEHDYMELIDRMYSATETPSIFDTAGWNPKSKKMQERAEKYVKYMLDLENQKKFYQINLSFSPFNAIYARAIELGYNPENYSPLIPIEDSTKPMSKGEKLYRIYIDRMANALYTFTPLLGEKNFSIISRPVENNEKNMQNFTVNDYEKIKQHVLENLYLRYLLDFQSEQKFVKSKEHAVIILDRYDELLSKIDTKLIPSGRFKELYLKRNPNVTEDEFNSKYKYVGEFNNYFKSLKNGEKLKNLKIRYLKIIDADGKLYLYDTLRLIPTDIQLNISTKDCITPKLSPEVVQDFKISKETIKGQY